MYSNSKLNDILDCTKSFFSIVLTSVNISDSTKEQMYSNSKLNDRLNLQRCFEYNFNKC